MLLFIPRAGEVHEMQSKSYDFHMRAQPARAASEVAIVRITTDDYETMFGARSPLDPAAVDRIVRAIELGGPAVIGVDLDIEPAGDSAAVPVVWASTTPERARATASRVLPRGLALVLADGDWVVRRFAPLVALGADTLPLFSTAVLQAAGRTIGGARRGLFAWGSVDPLRERLIEFRDASDARLSLSAAQLLELAASPGFARDGPLRGKIVLLGGDYVQARDRHLTPLGIMPGVEIWAQVIETELAGGGSVPPGWLWPVLLQLACATLIILLFRTASLRTAMLVGALALPALSVLCGLLAFGSAWHALYFFPSLIVILFWELYDRASDYLKLLHRRYGTAE